MVVDYRAAVVSAVVDFVAAADYLVAVVSVVEDSAGAVDYRAAVDSVVVGSAEVADYLVAVVSAVEDSAGAVDYLLEAAFASEVHSRISWMGEAEDSSSCLCRPAGQRQSPALSKAKAAKATLQTPSVMGSSNSWFSPQFSPQSQDSHSIRSASVEDTGDNFRRQF